MAHVWGQLRPAAIQRPRPNQRRQRERPGAGVDLSHGTVHYVFGLSDDASSVQWRHVRDHPSGQKGSMGHQTGCRNRQGKMAHCTSSGTGEILLRTQQPGRHAIRRQSHHLHARCEHDGPRCEERKSHLESIYGQRISRLQPDLRSPRLRR